MSPDKCYLCLPAKKQVPVPSPASVAGTTFAGKGSIVRGWWEGIDGHIQVVQQVVVAVDLVQGVDDHADGVVIDRVFGCQQQFGLVRAQHVALQIDTKNVN